MGPAAGNATEAARIAGYKGNDATLSAVGSENLRKPLIRSELDARVKADPGVMDREQLQRWWSELVRDSAHEPKDRLKASELLAKSQALFTEGRKHEGDAPAATVVVQLPDNGRG